MLHRKLVFLFAFCCALLLEPTYGALSRDPGAYGNPHFTGWDDVNFDFTGNEGAVYCMISDKKFHMNLKLGRRTNYQEMGAGTGAKHGRDVGVLAKHDGDANGQAMQEEEVGRQAIVGNWAEALTCCEQALQMDPKSVRRHEGVLNCLLNMGHLQAMATHVDGLLLRFPEKKKDWSMWGVQAAWRLGQRSLLDEYVQRAVGEEGQAAIIDSNDVFDLGIARVLLALHKSNDSSFSKSIIQSRHALLAPLAAASMESYSRAYPLIIKMHTLHELEIFHDLSMESERKRQACA